MSKVDQIRLKNAEILRKKAEETLMERKNQSNERFSEAELLKMVHELEVHQLELKMQYDELLIAKSELSKRADDKYAKLYNLAPVGFFTLSKAGEIIEVNQCGAHMLGKNQKNLINSRFGFFIDEKSKPVFNLFIDELFATHRRLSCELILNCPENIPMFVQLAGIESEKQGQCLITVTDISTHKIALAKPQKSEYFLKAAQRIVQLGNFSIDLVNQTWECSDVFNHIFGITSGFDKTIAGWTSLVHPDWLQKMREYFQFQVMGNYPTFEMEYKVIRQNDQQERWIHVTGQFEYNSFNQPLHLLGALSDITERKKAEEKLANSESFLNVIIDHSPNSLWISDDKGTLIRMNQACRNNLKIEDFEVVGKYNILNDSVVTAEGFLPLVKEVYEHGKTVDFVLPYNTANVKGFCLKHATQVVLIVHISPIFDKRGILTNAIIQHIDITKQIQAEQNIRDSEEKYRNVFSTEKDALFLIDKETYKIIEVNESACLLYGYTKCEFLNLYNFDLSAEPEESKRVREDFKTRIGLRYHKKKDGTVFPTDISASQFTLKGRQIILAAIRDISVQQQTEKALIESEERFRTVVESSSSSIIVHRDGKIIFVNTEAVKMFGANSKQDLVGCSIIDRIHPDFHRLIMERIQRGNDEGESVSVIGIKCFRLDGALFDAEVHGVQIIFDGLPAIQASIYDITERKQIEEEIRFKNMELQQVNAEKDKFFSIIAHDLKSPFNGFLGLTEMMTKELSEMTMKEVQEISLMLNKSANNLYVLIGNLLEWSKMQRGMVSFKPHSFALCQNIQQCLVSSIDIAQKKGITIRFDIPESLEVYADVNMLDTVLRNLVNNAIKFTSKGGNIVVRAKSDSAEIIEILIRDSGIGMSNYLIDNLFRLDMNTGRKGTEGESSTGLGLIICKDFIEKNGGSIWVESEEGEGSSFRFTVPAAIN